MNEAYDLIIIGGGPGGYVAAIRGSQLGLRTAVVEREHLGGICLNWGCIPTKALLRSAEVYRLIKVGESLGVGASAEFNLQKIVTHSREAARRLNQGVSYLLKKNKVDLIWGEAFLSAPGEVIVKESSKAVMTPQFPAPKERLGHGAYHAKHIVIATGARPRTIAAAMPDGQLIWTYFEALKPEFFPKSLLIIGAGAIGVEFASFYNAFGVEVSLIEAAAQILPNEDREIAALARQSFEKQGVIIKTETSVLSVEKKGDHVVVDLKGVNNLIETIKTDRVLLAIGVMANTENIGLETLGVALQKGVIKTDEFCRTNVPGLYAIGDVAGGPMLAHKAEHEGIVCVEAIAGQKTHALDKSRVPGCTYCYPQIASVGLTESASQSLGFDIRVGRFPFIANGKATAIDETVGLVKTIFDAKSGRLLGAHIFGAEATELIQGFAIAMNLETTEEDLMRTVFAHPTLSEAMQESVYDAYGRAIHI